MNKVNMPSLKRTLVNSVAYGTLKHYKGNEVILLTPAGILSGEFVECPESAAGLKSESAEFQTMMLLELSTQYKDEHQIQKVDGNDGFLPLKNVIFHCSNDRIYKFPYLTVFYDQIIAVAQGNFND